MPKMSLEEAVEAGLRFHQSGQLKQAEAIYMQVLQYDPRNADAMHLLGVLAQQGGESRLAIEMISRALTVKPEVAVIHFNLSEAYRTLREFEKAAQSLRCATDLDSHYVEAFNNLGLVLLELGQFEESEGACRRALELDPNFSGAWNNLGNALRLLERYDEAIAAYHQSIKLKDTFAEAWSNMAICYNRKDQLLLGIEALKTAIRLKPELPDAHNNLGVIYLKLGRHEEAKKSFTTAIRLKPDFADAKLNMGVSLRESGLPDQSLKLYQESLENKPGFAEAHNNLSVAYRDVGDLENALEHAEKALEIRPEYFDAIVSKAMTLKEMKDLQGAMAMFEKVVELKPDDPLGLNCLGLIYMEQGFTEEAKDYFSRSLEAKPDSQTYSNLLLCLNYLPDLTPEKIAHEHFTWGQLAEAKFRSKRPILKNKRIANRKLRVGYVSPDFKAHAVSYFSQCFLKHHDPEQVEVFAYSHLVKPDMMTAYLQSLVPNWRMTNGMSQQMVIDAIIADEIDILVDLAGHTAHSGIPVFAAHPAPVQVSMVGYPNTTGLRAMDYRITDQRLDPEGESEKLSSETLWRMPEIFWCYTPDETSRGITVRENSRGPIRFCSMNNLAKVTPQALSLWAKIVKQVPDSLLVIQGGGLQDELTRRRFRESLEAEGLDESRVEFHGWTNLSEYYTQMSTCDIGLDTFPFNGGTTTCHKLWMGLPVIALKGENHVSRMGYSILECLGLEELVATDHSTYVSIACELGNNRERLNELRLGLRERMENSPLMNEVAYTRNLESAYRQFWRKWCMQ